MPQTPQFWLKSSHFEVEPGEDNETNPFCYGKSLAQWLQHRLRLMGYQPEEVIADDWGWLVMLQRHPFLLWVGCANVDRDKLYGTVTPEQKPSFHPAPDSLTWTCFVGADVPFWTPFFWKRLVGKGNLEGEVQQLGNAVERILRSESDVLLVGQP